MPELKREQLAISYSDLSESTFFRVIAERVSFEDANLSGISFVNDNMAGASFRDVNLASSTIEDVNLSGTRIQHANLTGIQIDHVHLMGTQFRNVVLPREGEPNHDPQQNYAPVIFENCALPNALFTKSDLSNVEITGCNIKGLRINGVLVEELLLRVAEEER